MWFLARKEIMHDTTRFALFVALVGLVSFLVFVLTGLSKGLGEASVSGLRTVTEQADLVVFAPSVQRSLGRSDLDVTERSTIAETSGVIAVAPIGQSMINVTAPGGSTFAVALIGVPEDTPFTPADHTPPTDGLVLDADAATSVDVGDVVQVQPGGQEMTVTGFAPLGSLQHTPVGYTPLETWQRLRYDTYAADGGAVPDRAGAFLVQTADGQATAVSDALAKESLDPARPGAAIDASPGFKEETGTVNLIRTFLFGIAALLIGTVFWVLTLQKEGPLAVLRAAGARRALLIGSYIIQVSATVIAGVGVALATAFVAAEVLPASAYALTTTDVLTASALLVGLALAASAASMRRMFNVDPLLSLGRL